MQRIRTIYAIAKKGLIQFLRYPNWIMSAILWPLILPFIYIFPAIGLAGPKGEGFKAFSYYAKTSNFVGYIVVGSTIWSWCNITMWTFGTFLRSEQKRGTLESNWLCPINHFDILLGGAIDSIMMSLIFIIISVLEYKYIFHIKFTGGFFTWILIFLVLIPGVYGFSSILASLVLWAKETGTLVQIIRGIITIFCGISYPITILPKPARVISNIVPFTYGINLSRKLLIEGITLNNFSVRKDIFYCLFIGIILMILGRICFIKVEKKVKESGTLDMY